MLLRRRKLSTVVTYVSLVVSVILILELASLTSILYNSNRMSPPGPPPLAWIKLPSWNPSYAKTDRQAHPGESLARAAPSLPSNTSVSRLQPLEPPIAWPAEDVDAVQVGNVPPGAMRDQQQEMLDFLSDNSEEDGVDDFQEGLENRVEDALALPFGPEQQQPDEQQQQQQQHQKQFQEQQVEQPKPEQHQPPEQQQHLDQAQEQQQKGVDVPQVKVAVSQVLDQPKPEHPRNPQKPATAAKPEQHQPPEQQQHLDQAQEQQQKDVDVPQVKVAVPKVPDQPKPEHPKNSQKPAAAAVPVQPKATQYKKSSRPRKARDCIPGADPDRSPRARFLDWQQGKYVDPAEGRIGKDHVSDPKDPKYFIYRCDDGPMGKCSGWGDRVRGILAAYVIANLTGRVFKIEMLDQGCPLTNYVRPAKVNWSLSKSFHPNLTSATPSTQILDVVNDYHFAHNISTTNFSELLDPEAKYVYFKGNLNTLLDFRNSKVYKRELAWMQKTGMHRLHATLFRRLFKYTPELLTNLEKFLSVVQHDAGDKLLCAHVRIGDPLSFFNNFHHHMEFPSLSNLWTFLGKKSKDVHKEMSVFTSDGTVLSPEKSSNRTRIFITSDSSDVVQEAKNQSFSRDLLAVPGEIVHVDHNHDYSASERCNGLGKLLLEQAVLTNCDALVVGSTSGVSNQAAWLRASQRQLYRFTTSFKVEPIFLYC